MTDRPAYNRANACFLIAGVGLVLLNLLSPYLFALLRKIGVPMGQADLQCAVSLLYYLPFVFLPAVFYGKGQGIEALRLEPTGGETVLLAVAAAFVCMMAGTGVTAVWTSLLRALGWPLRETALDLRTTDDLLKAVVAVGAIPGICEELLFRGVMLGTYERSGTRRAILLTAALFTLLHGSVEGLPVQFGMGLMLGAFAWYTGSLYASMMLHTAYNSLLMMTSFVLQNRMEVTEEAAEGAAPVLPGILLAALFGVLLIPIVRRLRAIGRGEPIPKTKLGMTLREKLLLALGVIVSASLYVVNLL